MHHYVTEHWPNAPLPNEQHHYVMITEHWPNAPHHYVTEHFLLAIYEVGITSYEVGGVLTILAYWLLWSYEPLWQVENAQKWGKFALLDWNPWIFYENPGFVQQMWYPMKC